MEDLIEKLHIESSVNSINRANNSTQLQNTRLDHYLQNNVLKNFRELKFSYLNNNFTKHQMFELNQFLKPKFLFLTQRHYYTSSVKESVFNLTEMCLDTQFHLHMNFTKSCENQVFSFYLKNFNKIYFLNKSDQIFYS